MMRESAELRQAHQHFYNALTGGDPEAIAPLLSEQAGILFIGTAPEEWWADRATILRAVRAQIELFGTAASIVGSTPTAYVEGTVGWTADQCVYRIPAGVAPSEWGFEGTDVPMRITAVWHREDGQWKMVQGHTSVGVGSAEAFNQDMIL